MCRSLKEILRWYRDKVFNFSSVSNSDTLLTEVIYKLVDDKGNRAQDGLDALEYGESDYKSLTKVIEKSDQLLTIRSDCSKVIDNATDELISMFNKDMVEATEIICEFNHRFLALEDHPTIDDVPCCPHCLKQALINK